MSDRAYKQTAIELYMETVRKAIPGIEEWQLNLLKSAFTAGFNMGLVDDKGKEIQESALKIMVK